ncbi:hypothetical protein DFP72DRAFT_938268 [Ephemerocybe angulata]|uniref:Uncharacterized protein n=1 Tax=Ephemerocybe angulata TaxID=980116 RepID=A0A8H6LV95_9AGAR|nr:hypothetical protein DFP72DRAFT_938268 [Tulosesus angulatus]
MARDVNDLLDDPSAYEHALDVEVLPVVAGKSAPRSLPYAKAKYIVDLLAPILCEEFPYVNQDYVAELVKLHHHYHYDQDSVLNITHRVLHQLGPDYPRSPSAHGAEKSMEANRHEDATRGKAKMRSSGEPTTCTFRLSQEWKTFLPKYPNAGFATLAIIGSLWGLLWYLFQMSKALYFGADYACHKVLPFVSSALKSILTPTAISFTQTEIGIRAQHSGIKHRGGLHASGIPQSSLAAQATRAQAGVDRGNGPSNKAAESVTIKVALIRSLTLPLEETTFPDEDQVSAPATTNNWAVDYTHPAQAVSALEHAASGGGPSQDPRLKLAEIRKEVVRARVNLKEAEDRVKEGKGDQAVVVERQRDLRHWTSMRARAKAMGLN